MCSSVATLCAKFRLTVQLNSCNTPLHPIPNLDDGTAARLELAERSLNGRESTASSAYRVGASADVGIGAIGVYVGGTRVSAAGTDVVGVAVAAVAAAGPAGVHVDVGAEARAALILVDTCVVEWVGLGPRHPVTSVRTTSPASRALRLCPHTAPLVSPPDSDEQSAHQSKRCTP